MDTLTPAELSELTVKIANAVDSACWDARRQYGHDDFGLDDDVDINGQPVGTYVDGYHPCAIEATNAILVAISELLLGHLGASEQLDSIEDILDLTDQDGTA